MGLERTKVLKALKRKGFLADPDRVGQDHEWFRLYVGGRKTSILTKVSRGKKKYRDLGDDLVGKMAFQIALTVPQFKAFVDCYLSGDQYVAVLTANGHDFRPH